MKAQRYTRPAHASAQRTGQLVSARRAPDHTDTYTRVSRAANATDRERKLKSYEETNYAIRKL